MYIDSHTHVFPEKIAEATIKTLLSKLDSSAKAYSNGTLQGLKDSMKEAGIDLSVVLPVVTNPKHFDSVNKYAAQINGKDGIISFGGIHPDNDNPEEKLEFIKSLGLKGIKLHPDYQKTFIDDEKYIRIIKKCIELDLCVVIHSGIDIGMPEIVHCSPDRAINMINSVYKDKIPEKINIILAHIGACDMFDEVEQKLCGLNIAFDLSYCLDKIDKQQLMRIIHTHGADKILFATDCPWGGQKEFVRYFENLPLTENEKELISHKNAERIFKISL